MRCKGIGAHRLWVYVLAVGGHRTRQTAIPRGIIGIHLHELEIVQMVETASANNTNQHYPVNELLSSSLWHPTTTHRCGSHPRRGTCCSRADFGLRSTRLFRDWSNGGCERYNDSTTTASTPSSWDCVNERTGEQSWLQRARRDI